MATDKDWLWLESGSITTIPLPQKSRRALPGSDTGMIATFTSEPKEIRL